MDQDHCKELKEILTSKPHILERYGIIIIISILLLIGTIISNCQHIEQTHISQIKSFGSLEAPSFIARLEENKNMSSLLNSDFTLIINGRNFICRGVSLENAEDNIEISFKAQSIESSDSIRSLITSNSNTILLETHKNYLEIIINPIINFFN